MPVVRIVAATRNRAKVLELERLVGKIATVEPLPHDISHKLPPEPEHPTTTATAAGSKALAASALITCTLIVATDGGLLFPALPGWQPTMTRRFAGPDASDLERAQRLLALAAGLEGEERHIWWEESLAVAHDGEVLASWTARSGPGILAREVTPEQIRATQGFWISSLWLCPQFGNRRLMELAPDERDRLNDHWRQLGVHLRDFLSQRT